MAKTIFMNTGKVGTFIISTWKNKGYLKAYSIPKNPRTPLQMKNRKQWALVVKFASKINKQILRPYSPKLEDCSAYNKFISLNSKNVDENGIKNDRIQFFESEKELYASVEFIRKKDLFSAVKIIGNGNIKKLLCYIEKENDTVGEVFELQTDEKSENVLSLQENYQNAKKLFVWLVGFDFKNRPTKTFYIESDTRQKV